MQSQMKRLMRITAGYGLVQWSGPFISFIFTPIITRAVSPNAYGIAGYFAALSSAAAMLAMFGVREALLVHYNDRSEDTTWQRRLIGSALTISIIGTIIVSIGLLLTRTWLIPAQFQEVGYLALWMSGFLLFGALTPVITAGAQAGLHVRWGMVLSIVSILGVVLGNLLLVVFFRLDVTGMVLTPWLTNLAVASVGIWLMHKQIGKPNPETTQLLLYSGLILFPSNAAVWMLAVVDRLFLAPHVSATELGYYELANRITALLSVLLTPVFNAWVPLALSIQHQPNAKEQYADMSRYLSMLLLSSALFLGLFALDILLILTPRSYLPAATYVGFLSYMSIFSGFTSILATAGLAGKQLKEMTFTVLIGALVNLILNMILIPSFGTWGATIATVIGFATVTILTYPLLQRRNPIPYPTVRILCAFGIQFLLLYLGLMLPPLAWPLRLAIKSGLLLILLGSFVGLRLVTRQELQIGSLFLTRHLRGIFSTS